MKFHHLLILIASLLAFSACKPKPTGEKVKDAVDDALDRRPAEKVRDAAENVEDAAKESVKEAEEALKELTQ